MQLTMLKIAFENLETGRPTEEMEYLRLCQQALNEDLGPVKKELVSLKLMRFASQGPMIRHRTADVVVAFLPGQPHKTEPPLQKSPMVLPT